MFRTPGKRIDEKQNSPDIKENTDPTLTMEDLLTYRTKTGELQTTTMMES